MAMPRCHRFNAVALDIVARVLIAYLLPKRKVAREIGIEKLTLITPRQLSLEEAIEFINDDELIEVTPKSIRLRKVVLDTPSRKRIQAQKRAALKENK